MEAGREERVRPKLLVGLAERVARRRAGRAAQPGCPSHRCRPAALELRQGDVALVVRDAGAHGVRAPLEHDRGGVRHLARYGAAARLSLSGAHLSAFRVVAFLRRRFGACSLGFVLKRS
jgi:hypothetical protein